MPCHLIVSTLHNCLNIVFSFQVGDDSFGQNYLKNFKDNNVEISFVGVSKEAATGVATIVVDDAGVAAHWCFSLFALSHSTSSSLLLTLHFPRVIFNYRYIELSIH